MGNLQPFNRPFWKKTKSQRHVRPRLPNALTTGRPPASDTYPPTLLGERNSHMASVSCITAPFSSTKGVYREPGPLWQRSSHWRPQAAAYRTKQWNSRPSELREIGIVSGPGALPQKIASTGARDPTERVVGLNSSTRNNRLRPGIGTVIKRSTASERPIQVSSMCITESTGRESDASSAPKLRIRVRRSYPTWNVTRC